MIPGFVESLGVGLLKDAVKGYVGEYASNMLQEERSWLPEHFRKLFRRRVVVAGIAGSGKSILVDRLAGRIGDFYQRPDNTIAVEDRKAHLGGVIYQLIDTRGQRTVTDLNDVSKIKGIIWVLSNGLAETDTISPYELKDIVEKTRAYEIEKLKEGLTFIREKCRKGKIWVLVALTKYDLYQSYLDLTETKRSAEQELRERASQIQKELVVTKNLLGSNFAFDVVPFVGFSSDFRIGQRELPSKIDSQFERELCLVSHRAIRRLESM